jgi:hypothetical protein
MLPINRKQWIPDRRHTGSLSGCATAKVDLGTQAKDSGKNPKEAIHWL